MSRHQSAGSIFWGFVLVAIGPLLLARNFGYSIPVWSGLTVYWPVLIIVWGLVKLIDYFRMSRNGDKRRMLFSPGEVAMLILLIFAGTAFIAAANFSPGFAEFLNLPVDFDFWDITGNNYEFTEHLESEIAPGSTIEITNLYGDVDVQPSGSGQVVLDVTKTVRASNQQEADSRAAQFTFAIRTVDGKVRIVSSRDENSESSSANRPGNERQRYKSSLVVRVPESGSLQLSNRNGTVQVSGLTGSQSIINRYGQVTVRNITGAVTVENRYAGIVVDGISAGGVRVENRFGPIDVRNVNGNATIANTFSSISVENIEGQLDITGRNNSVDMEGISGAVSTETSYKGLSIRNAEDRIQARNTHGDITIEFDRAPRQPVSISGEFGDVVLNLPADAAFRIDAKTRSGDITSEFDGPAVSSSRREQSLSGQVGTGGPQITIETSNGDIRIGKRE